MIYLTVDFGSTYTKLTVIDDNKACIVGSSSAFTTIQTDIMEGFNNALEKLKNKIGEFSYNKLLCCSSAAGGLKMVALGLVPELTAKAAKLAASSAGAKVIKTYSFEISRTEQNEIYDINPDLVLLSGGTDGGNKDVVIKNAQTLCEIDRNFSVIIAANKSASNELEEIFKASGKDYIITDNVMPTFNKLNITPAQKSIKTLFLKNIIEAKGLSKVQQMADQEVIPTPFAVIQACQLLSKGTKTTPGLGNFVAVDVGGATTDVYSMAKGEPSMENVVLKGFPEPFSKRTVEGDLGMRYSLKTLLGELDTESLAQELNIDQEKIHQWVQLCTNKPETIAPKNSAESKIDEALAKEAIKIALERHCGILEKNYTPMGEVFSLNGKDLTTITTVIGIGGVIINADEPSKILDGVKYTPERYNYMKPKNPNYLLDKKYIFASMGLLSNIDPELALKIMLKEII